MYLANNPLANNTFKTVTTKPLCQQIHHYLFDKLKLLDRVIRARKMHKSLFYSMDYDYGHSKFIENLEEEQVTVSRALERIEHRTVEVLYKKEKWYDWVRKCQEGTWSSLANCLRTSLSGVFLSNYHTTAKTCALALYHEVSLFAFHFMISIQKSCFCVAPRL